MFITVCCCERDIETPKLSSTWLKAQTLMAEDIAETYDLDVNDVLAEILAAEESGEEREYPDQDLVITGDSAYGEVSHNNMDWKIFEVSDVQSNTTPDKGADKASGGDSDKNPDKTSGEAPVTIKDFTDDDIDEMKSLMREFCQRSASVNACDPDRDCEFCPVRMAYDKIAEGVPTDPEDTDETDDG